MALGLRGWIVLALVLLSAVAVWLVPPGQVVGPKRNQATEAHQAWAELEGELRREAWLYQHLQLRDSLVSELGRAVASGENILLGTPPETPDSLTRRLEVSVDQHLHRIGLEEPAMPLGIFFVPRTQFLHPDLPGQYAGRGGSYEYYVARGDAAPFCIIGVPYQDDLKEDRPSWSTDPLTRRIRTFANPPYAADDPTMTLRMCTRFVQHGQPGERIYDWLQRGAFNFSSGVPSRNLYAFYQGNIPSRGPFGAPTYLSRMFTPKGLACLQGDAEACLKIALQPGQRGDPGWDASQYVPGLRTSVSGSPVDFHGSNNSVQPHFAIFDQSLFAALEEEFGPERFGEFWRSAQEPEVAFREAFGQPMDQWIMEWIRGYVEPAQSGPGVPFQATFLAFITLGILAGGAVRMAGRRSR